MKVKTGGCSKCGGDVFIDTDIYGDENVCLQCGASRKISDAEAAELKAERNKHGYDNSARPVKRGKSHYGRSKIKEAKA